MLCSKGRVGSSPTTGTINTLWRIWRRPTNSRANGSTCGENSGARSRSLPPRRAFGLSGNSPERGVSYCCVMTLLEIAAEGDLDARRLFGLDETLRAGFTDVRLAISITGPETEERYRELRAAVDAHCPVLDLFANPTPVTATVSKA
ncbi:MAG TPA: hypothetical protein DCP11_02445 [Microbacteriaceae bacterium]|nr:hypothetical protein [Microbacteriaceae bacterium]